MAYEAVKSTARCRKKPAILAPFEKTLHYDSQVGEKAARTRRLRAAKAEEQMQPPAPAEPAAEPQ